MENRFYIQLDNSEVYALEIDFNLQEYVIKKGFLYRKHKKLGKIIGVKAYDNIQ